MHETFTCIDCGKVEAVRHDGGTGYAETDKGKVCYECCAVRDRASMVKDGRATLYLTNRPGLLWSVSNWPGTLGFMAQRNSRGRHNIAGVRFDIWFNGPDGHEWHGVTYGVNTELCHCKRTRHKVA